MEALVKQTVEAYFRWMPFSPDMSKNLQNALTGSDDLSSQFQTQFLSQVTDDKYRRTLPSASNKFLKKLISALEEAKVEVSDELYDLLATTMSSGCESEHFYKTYFVGHIHFCLAESAEFLSQGTTGLRTWEAAEFMLDWCQKNPKETSNKHLLELGSGLGYLGIGLIKLGLARRVIMTDCHPQVLANLRHNCSVNLDEESFSVRRIDWTEEGQSDPVDQTEVVIASDVVFDPKIVPSLVQSIRRLLVAGAERALIACTVRNEGTLAVFEKSITESEGLSFDYVATEGVEHDAHVRLYNIFKDL